MSGGRDLTLEVPDGLVGVRELLGQEAATVVAGEDPGVAPALSGQRAGVLLRDGADIQDVHDEQVAGLRAPDGDGTAQLVNGQQRGVADILGRVVVADGPVEPFPAVNPEAVPRL